MPSPDPILTTLPEQLRQLGLTQTATDLNDLVARIGSVKGVDSVPTITRAVIEKL